VTGDVGTVLEVFASVSLNL